MNSLEDVRDAKGRIEKAESNIKEFKLVLVGLGLGIVGNLWANLLWELFTGHEFIFFIVLILLTALVFNYIFEYMLTRIDSTMNGNSILKKQWSALKKEINLSIFFHNWIPQVMGGAFGLVLFSLAVYLWYPSLLSDLWWNFTDII